MMNDFSWIDSGLTSAEFCSSDRFLEALSILRMQDPVHWTAGSTVRPFWSVTSYAGCRAVLDNAEAFSSRRGGFMPLNDDIPSPEQERMMGIGFIPTHVDPPEHMRVRKPLSPYFSPSAAARYREAIEAVVSSIMDSIKPKGACDLVSDVAQELPARFICSLLGVPEEDQPRIAHLTRGVMSAEDPEYQIDNDPVKTRKHYQGELFRYAAKHTVSRRGQPASDLAGLIANTDVATGDPITDTHLGWWTFALFVGGLETTRSVISLGTKALIEWPEQMEMLRRNPQIAPLAVEELLRWVSPSRQKFRIATRDIEVEGKTIKAGDWVVCWLSSANRDPLAFHEPERLQLDRKPNAHLSFGSGEHRCMGQNFARLELQAMFRAISAELGDLELAAEPVVEPSTFANSVARMPVRFRV
ncbi:cytochrome P450 [Novosphingobium sp.]|uniref:cytochrome P450 n=1 Tax=Novosphingobium sp. TaxID=1874826 RepID=UPI0026236D2A|nr:cytochrome P450 [Novosphingobium sp.]